MKKTMLTFAAVLAITTFAFAQDIPQSKVPPAVVNSFTQTFTGVRNIEWEMKDDLYNVSFDKKGKDHEAWYDVSGKLVKHVQDINKSELPNAVREAIKTQFSGFRISDPEKMSEGGVIKYKVELKKLNSELDVIFDSAGKVLDQRNS